jgi:hypothetical protein
MEKTGGMVQGVFEEADFSEVLERVPIEVRRTLSFDQRVAITRALQDSRRKHSLDARFVIPFFFTQFYVVFQAGKDLRRDTQTTMIERRTNASRWSIAMLIGLGGMILIGVAVNLAYIGKSRAGIDLLPNAHAKDVLQGLGIH